MSAGRVMIQPAMNAPPTVQKARRITVPDSESGGKASALDRHSSSDLLCCPTVGDKILSFSAKDGDCQSDVLVFAAIISGPATASTPVACGKYQAGSLDAQAKFPCIRQEFRIGTVAGSCGLIIHNQDILHWFLEHDCFKGLCAQALHPNRAMLQSRDSSETTSAMNAAIGRLQGAIGIHSTKEELSESYFHHWAEAYDRDGPYAPGQPPFEQAIVLSCDSDMSEARRSKL